MKKSFLFGSVVATIALLSGCGGSSGVVADKTAPNFTNTDYSFDIDEGTDKSVSLTANETGVSFTEDSAEAAINGLNLVFNAPNFNSSGENSYTVNVIAKDEAGNASAAKAFTFNVKAVITESYEFNSSYVAPIGGKDFEPKGGNLEDPSGLLWDDTVSTRMSYDAAKTYCEAKGTGWRMPTRAEFLNVIDYSKVTTTGSLIDSDFSNYSANAVEVSWVENLTSDKYVVNHADGTDSTPGNNLDYNVLCVYGDKDSTAHTFTSNKDDVTGLTWTTINASNTPSTHIDAVSGCANEVPMGDWHLPTINELRSIINYNTNTIPASIASGTPTNPNTYFIWSSTPAKDRNSNNTYYTVYLDGVNTKAGVISDEHNMTHYFTCVK